MNENIHTEVMINHYEEAVEYIEQVGILPLASLIPDYPSLESITPKDSWHSDTEDDPWSWRTRFPLEGKAAYGKFFKKKAVFVSSEWFPWVYTCLSMGTDAEKCYRDGLLSRTAWQLYQLIDTEQGIDTRMLRERALMKAKEDKKAFDQAIIELQESLFIVISGVKAKVNEMGEVNGWSSTSYETAENWMRQNGIKKNNRTKEEAREELLTRLGERSSDKALMSFKKIFNS
ncbi:hypothetical protein J23TS9_11380 [Paenibacillus sp. J23TS9]|uniref:AlkZ-related protein n=1 Tax=Paenibacillus sp. J23TS9 TaxID=2807193 RepID=UPI001B2D3038|nr:hypothetical protein [Paenibacillus sp. J23TS9]GIP26008.1 hypothetical protein J23TS9_11380 [Paenibacillus sp. J23TS9]